MSGCHLKGKPWTLSGVSHCGVFLKLPCKICDSPICYTHSMVHSDGLICESCIALCLPDKTDSNLIGKDYFSEKTIRRVERIYLTTTKACKQ